MIDSGKPSKDPRPLRWDLGAEVTCTLQRRGAVGTVIVVSSATPLTAQQLRQLVEQKLAALIRRHNELTWLLTHLEYDAVEGLVSASSPAETEEKSAPPAAAPSPEPGRLG